jgi:hypothetical protein
MSMIQPSSFLRRVLLADAAVSAAVGALMALGAGALQAFLGLPAALLTIAGVALFPYAAYLVWLATRATVPRVAVWVPIALNVIWAADCLLVLFATGLQPTLVGEAFVVVQVITVLAFADPPRLNALVSTDSTPCVRSPSSGWRPSTSAST